MEILIGKAPLTVVRMADGRRVNVPRGSVVPEGFDLEDAERLYAEDYLEVIEVDGPSGDSNGDPTGDPNDQPVDVGELLKGSVDAVLDTVGDDVDLAVAALAAEQAGSARKGVLKGLQEVIDSAPSGDDS